MEPSDLNFPNRPTVFSDIYPPSHRTPFDWNSVQAQAQGASQPHYEDYSIHQTPGFNMQPHTGANFPNFQFSNNAQSFGRTVQFPFPNVHQGQRAPENPMCMFRNLRCKRRTASPPSQPSKRHITEEKMTEHLSKLHISSETPSSEMESEQVKEQRLYVCEEMKKFQAQTDSIIPESLLSGINRPCTALVLWRPPTSILSPSVFNCDGEENESENNNNNSARDNNPVNLPVNDMEFDDL